jgi:AcrR family transcriptional regulator
VTDRLPHPPRSGAADDTLRSDAAGNRDRILDAARALFVSRGPDVPMREIARHAGVGPATLYRRFPTKRDLVAEALADRMRACRDIAEEGLADPDPWRGFRRVIERICALHARDRGLTEAFVAGFPDALDLAAGRAETLRTIAELARRAKDSGDLRPDFVLADLILVLMANKGIQAPTPAARAAASRRFAAYVVQAFRASPDHTPLPPVAGPL